MQILLSLKNSIVFNSPEREHTGALECWSAGALERLSHRKFSIPVSLMGERTDAVRPDPLAYPARDVARIVLIPSVATDGGTLEGCFCEFI
jgi:hypothetical protein